MPKRRPSTTVEEQFRFVEAFLAGDKNHKEFSETNNISIHSLRRWLYKYRKHQASEQTKNSGSSFIPIEVEGVPDLTSLERIEIHYSNGTKLLLPVHTDVSVLKSLTP